MDTATILASIGITLLMIIISMYYYVQGMNVNYCIVLTMEDDEVYIDEVDAAAFDEVKCQMN